MTEPNLFRAEARFSWARCIRVLLLGAGSALLPPLALAIPTFGRDSNQVSDRESTFVIWAAVSLSVFAGIARALTEVASTNVIAFPLVALAICSLPCLLLVLCGERPTFVLAMVDGTISLTFFAVRVLGFDLDSSTLLLWRLVALFLTGMVLMLTPRGITASHAA
ncbi:hypothetical protein LJR290_007511 [Variovorax sp. LjRoot290]|uniref:hypothetical protein n=1 Tax=Variovorax sp. LjRoot290 TaxID=3342316 RepID=UPI003ED05894